MKFRLISTSVAAIGAIALFGLIYYFTQLLLSLVERIYITHQGILGFTLLDLGASTPTSSLIATVVFFTIVASILPIIVLLGLIGQLIVGIMSRLYRDLDQVKQQLHQLQTQLQDTSLQIPPAPDQMPDR